jgi:hypothetical protein
VCFLKISLWTNVELYFFDERADIAVMFLGRIREEFGSNLGWEVDYPDRDFSWFSSLPPSKCQDLFFSNHSSSVIQPFYVIQSSY